VPTHSSMLRRYCQMTVTGSTTIMRIQSTPSNLVAPLMPIVLHSQLPVVVALRLLFSTLAHAQYYRLACILRADNAVIAISGSTNTHMVQENGARMVTETLTPGQMAILPQGSMHTMINNGEYRVAFFGGCRRNSCVNR
jgi:hypothetical protein